VPDGKGTIIIPFITPDYESSSYQNVHIKSVQDEYYPAWGSPDAETRIFYSVPAAHGSRDHGSKKYFQ
jgi:hypothetical protein